MSDTRVDVLVTGCSGFMGRHVLPILVQEGLRVAGVTRRSGASPFLQAIGDLRQPGFADEALGRFRPASILHLAGATGRAPSDVLFSDNVLATIDLVTAAKKLAEPPRIVLVSSSSVYAPSSAPISETGEVRPVSLYGVSKAAQEMAAGQLARQGAIPLVVARVFNVVGPGQSSDFVLGRVAQAIAAAELGSSPELSLGNLSSARDFVDVRDVARALVLLSQVEAPTGTFNVAAGEGRPIRAAIEHLVSMASCPITVRGEDQAAGSDDVAIQVGDAARLRRAMSWSPDISFQQSLTDLLDSWRQRLREGEQ